MCLIDVASGSDTKLMVKSVLDWAKSCSLIKNDTFYNQEFSDLKDKYLNLEL